MSRLRDGTGAGGVHGGGSLTALPWACPLLGERRGWTVEDWLDCVTARLQQGGHCTRRSKHLLDERAATAACRRPRRPRGHRQLGDSKFRGPRPGPQGAARRSALSELGAQNLRSPPWTTGRGFVTEAPAGKGGAAEPPLASPFRSLRRPQATWRSTAAAWMTCDRALPCAPSPSRAAAPLALSWTPDPWSSTRGGPRTASP